MKERPIYVVGHLNPDTDSIASAIAYAHLKNKLGFNCVPARLGHVSSEAEYLLERFGFEEPVQVFTARCTIADIEIDDAHLVSKDLTMKEALDIVLKRKNKGIFVVDENYQLEGVVSVTDLTSFLTVNEDKLIEIMSTVSLENLTKTLKADILNKVDNFKTSGTVDFFPSMNIDSSINKGSIAIVPNNPDIQRRCIEAKVSLIVIVGEDWVDSLTLKQAKENNIAVIYTPLSPLVVSQVIFQAPSVKHIMGKDIISVQLNETIEEASAKISKSRFRGYPVIDEYNTVIGAISRYHLFNYDKKEFILMDHNETKQSVPDIEHGRIIEIVDHHRIGGIKTDSPIEYTCMVVGSTCTIVALKYQQNNIEITKAMAGLLLGGIIADTLNLKSPTTSKLDHEMVELLSKIAEVDPNELSEGLINSSASILNKRFVEIVYQDFKEFKFQENRVAIGQTQCKSKEEFVQIKDKLQDYLNEMCAMNKYDVLLLLLTNPSGSGSYFLVTGAKSQSIYNALTNAANEDGFVKGIISRKKQIVPMIEGLFSSR